MSISAANLVHAYVETTSEEFQDVQYLVIGSLFSENVVWALSPAKYVRFPSVFEDILSVFVGTKSQEPFALSPPCIDMKLVRVNAIIPWFYFRMRFLYFPLFSSTLQFLISTLIFPDFIPLMLYFEKFHSGPLLNATPFTLCFQNIVGAYFWFLPESNPRLDLAAYKTCRAYPI